MNIRYTPLLLTLAALTAVAQAEEKKEFPAREQKGPQINEEMRQKMILKRFDKDGDGQLNAEEKEAAEGAKKDIMKKFDKDGDGQLGPEERKAFMEERRKAMGGPEGKGGPEGNGGPALREGGGPGGRQGPGMNPEAREMMMKKFDKDGDGKLNDEERKALMDDRKKMMEKFDADGDGKLSDEERAKLHESLKVQKAE